MKAVSVYTGGVWGCLEECHEGESLNLTQISLLYRCQDPDSTQHNTRSHREICYMSKANSFVTVRWFSVLSFNRKRPNREGKQQCSLSIFIRTGNIHRKYWFRNHGQSRIEDNFFFLTCNFITVVIKSLSGQIHNYCSFF